MEKQNQFSIERTVTHALIAAIKAIYTHEGLIGSSSLKSICIWKEKVRNKGRKGRREGEKEGIGRNQN